MVYQDLVDFVRGARSLGYEETDIIQTLEAAGWRGEDVREAIAVAASLGQKEFTKAQLETSDFDAGKELMQTERAKADEASKILDVVKIGGEDASHFPTMAAWFTCITNPVITFRKSRYHAGYLKAVLGFGLPPAFIALLMIVASSVGAIDFLSNAGFLADLPATVILDADAALMDAGPVTAAAFLALIFVAGAVSGFIKSVLPHFIARAMGGKATFKQQSYTLSIAFAGSLALLVPAVPFAMAAFVGLSAAGAPLSITAGVSALIALALVVHALVILPVYAVREAQSISTVKAFAAVWLIPVLGAAAFVAYALLS
jgi:hypothetical protein